VYAIGLDVLGNGVLFCRPQPIGFRVEITPFHTISKPKIY